MFVTPPSKRVPAALTYAEATRRAQLATWLAAATGFAVVAAVRVQLALGWTTPLAYDVTVWTVIVAVSVIAVTGAGVCVWMRVTDQLVLRRHQRARRAAAEAVDTAPLMTGRHRLGSER